jgi:SnoaL-like domain
VVERQRSLDASGGTLESRFAAAASIPGAYRGGASLRGNQGRSAGSGELRAPGSLARSSLFRVGFVDEVIATYFAAWNERDPERRRQTLERSVATNVELVDPTGRWHGVAGLVDRIGRYQAAAPGTEVVPASGVDAHNDVVRYSWKIADGQGEELMEGIDVADRADDGRLKRILMFHGPFPPRG